MTVALALLIAAVHATGLPPWEQLTVVDADCQPTYEVDDELTVTFARMTGTCAPPRASGEDSCSRWVTDILDARELIVRRQDCEEPLPGRFVQDGSCGELPRWRWKGRLDAGHTHIVGRDFGPQLALIQPPGEPSEAACPAVSPLTDALTTEVETQDASHPQWIAFPAEDYAVVADGETARLQWTPGPTLRHWMLGDPDVVFVSDPMATAAAQAVLAGARREPTGIAVSHQIVQYRIWYEGWRQRGVPRCERLLEQDVEQRIRAAEGDELSPPIRATVSLRQPAQAMYCFPDEAE